jgi:hypothetical protein
MAIPGVLMVSSILVALSIRSWAALLEFAFIDALIAGGTIGCLVTAPWSFHRETATWSLTISSSVIRLGKQVPGLAPVSQEIQRPDAGNLDLLIQQRAFGKGGYTTLAWAAGSSLDGATTIRLDNYSVATGTGVMGLLRRVQVAVVLVSWWPANSLTSPTIQAFERAGLTFWQPDGAPPRPKVPFARLDR